MGLFDLFGKKSGQSAVQKLASKVADKRGMAPDRWEAIQALTKIDSEEAVVAYVLKHRGAVGYVSGTADLLLFNEAETQPGPGFGLRIGAGYSALGSTFEFTEHTPIVRAGFLISNIRVTYAYSFGRETIVDHQLGIGIKFDW